MTVSGRLQKALNRLNGILPLKVNQDKCKPPVKALHQQILRSFIDAGRSLTQEEIGQLVETSTQAIETLRQYDMITVSDDGEPDGAYPFTMDEREYQVVVNGHRLFAMCALDALAIAPMFSVATRISSQCRISAKPVEILMLGETVQNLEQVADIHIGIGWAAVDAKSSCADSLCTEMIFLHDGEIAKRWLLTDSRNREIFNLKESVQFASLFFVPLLS